MVKSLFYNQVNRSQISREKLQNFQIILLQSKLIKRLTQSLIETVPDRKRDRLPSTGTNPNDNFDRRSLIDTSQGRKKYKHKKTTDVPQTQAERAI